MDGYVLALLNLCIFCGNKQMNNPSLCCKECDLFLNKTRLIQGSIQTETEVEGPEES